MKFGIGAGPRSRSTLALLATVGVAATVAVGCGGSSDKGGEGDEGDAIAEVDPRFTSLSAEGQKLVAGVVNDDQPHHVETGMALSFAGVSTESDKPFIISDVDADGDSHMVLDLNAASMSNGQVGAGAAGSEFKMEQWTDGEWLYMEYIGFEAGQGGAADFPFAGLMGPGLFKVDLNRLEDETDLTRDPDGILEQSIGEDMDLTPFLYTLAANADDAVPDPDDPSKMMIDTTFGEIRQQLDDENDSAPLIDDFTDLSVDVDAEAVLEAIDAIPMVFIYSVDDQERIDDVTIDLDLGSFFASLSGELTGGDAALGDMEMSFEMSMAISYDNVEDITMPTGVDDDRTDAFIEAVQQAEAMSAEATTDTPTETTEG